MQIPVIIISGFLGSGKTTLLLQLLEQMKDKGLTPGILMNELGKQDVDGWIVEGQTEASIQKLLDGCLCCNRKSELLSSLLTLIETQPELVVIELTGVADPEEIAAALHAPEVQEKMRLLQVITVVDAEHILEYNSFFASDRQLVQTLRRQLTAADLILINKSDLTTADKLHKIHQQIRKYNKHAVLQNTSYSLFDARELLQLGQSADSAQISSITREPLAAEGSPADNHNQHTSFGQIKTITLSCSPHQLLSRQRIEQFLLEEADGLLRAKGYLRTIEDSEQMLIQYAGHRISWSSFSYPGSPYLVLIGSGLREHELQERWQQLVDSLQRIGK